MGVIQAAAADSPRRGPRVLALPPSDPLLTLLIQLQPPLHSCHHPSTHTSLAQQPDLTPDMAAPGNEPLVDLSQLVSSLQHHHQVDPLVVDSNGTLDTQGMSFQELFR